MEKSAQMGFTLVELLVVVIILAILSAVIVPQILDASEEAEISAAQGSLRGIGIMLDAQYQLQGEWPNVLDATWFRGHKLPQSPWKPLFNGEASNTYGNVQWIHPERKTVETHDHPYWYNNLNGTIRIRVPDQGNTSATIAFYNHVNQTNAGSLAQTAR